MRKTKGAGTPAKENPAPEEVANMDNVATLPTNVVIPEAYKAFQPEIGRLFKYEKIYKNTNNGFAVEFRNQIVALHQGGYRQAEIAEALHCSLGVVNKWIKRYVGGDLLGDKSRAPLHREEKNTQFHQYLVAEILKKYPFYGSRRVAREIEKEFGIQVSHVTVAQMMQEIAPKKEVVIPDQIEINEVDAIWHMDMTQMRIARGRKQYIFAIIDACTRRILAIKNYDHAVAVSAVDCLKLALKHNGGKKPRMLYTDNGRMFVSNIFQTFLREQVIFHHKTDKGSPWQNGKVERLFGTLFREWIAYRRYMVSKSLLVSLEEFRHWFNNEREIQKLEYKTPIQIMREKN
jgi:transposase